jgi:Ser/Thr protein kinase RdoA (MazF antagonist)
MDEEIPLAGGALTGGVVRVGRTVRRPIVTPLAKEVLQRLERAGFDDAPRWLGVDDQGRETLSWIDGETFTERGRMHPYIGDPPDRIVFSDAQVRAVFRLLRRFHDAFGDEIVCHGDFGPWNLVWRDGLPVAVIDFDHAHRGDPGEDVGYALRMFVSYGHAHATPDDLVERTRAALDAYGRSFDVPELLEREYDRAEAACLAHGWDRQLAKLPAERDWLRANRGKLARLTGTFQRG